MLKLISSDGHIIELEEKYSSKSNLLKNISEYPVEDQPPKILVSKQTMLRIYEFMQKDNHILKKDFNPLEIHFSYEFLHYFDNCSPEELLDVCNGANYLEYPFLLELCCKILANEISEGVNDRIYDLSDKLLGDKRINEEDLQKTVSDFEWINYDM